MNLLRPTGGKPVDPAVAQQTPLKEDLVAYLNNNSARIPGIQSDDVTLTCYANSAVGIPISGVIRSQGTRNFRLLAKFGGNTEVDLGSNSQEFWFWIPRGAPYLAFCSYQALEEGSVKQMPLPFQPEWVLEAMGMGNYGSADKYELATVPGQSYKLIERTKSPQGVPVKKIIVFDYNDRSKQPEKPQVTDYLEVDERSGKEICSAKITRRQRLPNNAEIPRELELRWPEEKLKLVLRIDRAQLTQNFSAQVFVRPHLQGIQSYDLATGRPEGPLQPAGGVQAPPARTPR
jgi:hypothetical protein